MKSPKRKNLQEFKQATLRLFMKLTKIFGSNKSLHLPWSSVRNKKSWMKAKVATNLWAMETKIQRDRFWNGRTPDLVLRPLQLSTLVTTATPSKSITWLDTAANKAIRQLGWISKLICVHGTTRMRQAWKTLSKLFRLVARGQKQSGLIKDKFPPSKARSANLISTTSIGKRTSIRFSHSTLSRQDPNVRLFSGRSVLGKLKLWKARILTEF